MQPSSPPMDVDIDLMNSVQLVKQLDPIAVDYRCSLMVLIAEYVYLISPGTQGRLGHRRSRGENRARHGVAGGCPSASACARECKQSNSVWFYGVNFLYLGNLYMCVCVSVRIYKFCTFAYYRNILHTSVCACIYIYMYIYNYTTIYTYVSTAAYTYACVNK